MGGVQRLKLCRALGEWERTQALTQSLCWFITSCRGLGTGLGLAGAELMTNGSGQAADSLGFVLG